MNLPDCDVGGLPVILGQAVASVNPRIAMKRMQRAEVGALQSAPAGAGPAGEATPEPRQVPSATAAWQWSHAGCVREEDGRVRVPARSLESIPQVLRVT